MDNGAEYINITFKGMEMAFNMAGKPIGAVLRQIKLILHGICGAAKEKIDYMRDKDGVRSAAELRKLQYERSKPIEGEVEIRQLYDRYGADWDYLSLPIEHDPEALANFEKCIKEKGLCYAKAKDYDKTDNAIQIVVPREQRGVYLAFFEVLNQELMPELDEKIKGYMEKINELLNTKNELNAKVKYLMQQRLKDDISPDEAEKIDEEISAVKNQVEGMEREAAYVGKLKEKTECAKYSEIDLSDYVDTAGGKSKEAFERDGDLDTLECGELSKYTRRGFHEETFDGQKDYLMNVGCSNVYIERTKLTADNGEHQYSFALYDNGVKVNDSELKVTIDTGNADINAFEKLVSDYVHTKITELSDNKEYIPDKTDCGLFERIEEMEVLTKKMENFNEYVRDHAKKTPSSKGLASDEDMNVMRKLDARDKQRRDINLRTEGIRAYVPVEAASVQNEDLKITIQGEHMIIPKGEFICTKKTDEILEVIVGDPDKKRTVFTENKEAATYEASFGEFGKTYVDKFKQAAKAEEAVAKSVDETKESIDKVKAAIDKEAARK